ncbi:uncharacterized protein LOC143296799 isoform X1 [Babylonia areolata]|uniref:uncharacterized protein LOC143296799 isoform X1 n=1 Tax=Babylonia areolata TaxID=304850 RepID=UPI003FD47F30
MVDPNAVKFISSLVKSLQMVCHGFMEFSDNIEIIGHINLRIDNRQKFDYIVNEQVSKQGGESTVFLSNSYHSLPPPKCNGGERERSFSSKFEEDGNVNNHHRLDESVAAMGGSRVQVDLSGPVPVTRSTSAPSHDGFFSTAGNNHRRSQSRDSRLHSAEEEQTAATAQEDHSFNHSSSAPSKDREQMDREEVGLAGSRGGGGERSEHNSVMSMYKETDIARQQSLGHRQDVIIKPEPNELFNSAMDESGGGLARDSDVLDASSTSSVLPAAHQSATVLATAAHTGHTMLAATTLGHPGFFDASLTSQDVTDTGESSYHSVTMSKERDLGQDLSEQSSQNGEAMSLVTRARTPPDLSYPQGPTQLPQTANIVEKESAPVPEKNHCSHCSKNFRTSDLLSMHIALIHTRRNYHPPKSLMSSPSSYMTSSSSLSPSQSQAGLARRASQSPGHQSTSSNSSRSKSQSPISMMSHTQPLALTQTLPHTCHQSTPSPSSLGMTLPNLPNTLSTTSHDPTSSANVTAAAIAALAQSYAFEPSQVGPMMGGQGAGSLQTSSHQCHLCHMPFVSWALLAQHQSQCPRRGPHRCEQCGKAFRSKTSLTDHINTIHRGVLFICRGCRETFKWRTHIYQHKRKCPALLNLTFETGSFIEEVYPPPPPPEVPTSAPMVQLPAEDSINMAESDQMQ